MKRAWTLCAAAVAMDAALLVLMQGVALSEAQLWTVVLAHAGLCLVFSMALVRLLPEQLRRPALAARLFVFLGTVFIPVLGMGGFMVFIVPALRQRLRAQPDGWQHTHAPSLPAQPVQRQGAGAAPRGSDLAGILRHAADPGKRTAALIATLALHSQQAVPLLRLALKDPDDEVRLLAYALFSLKEKTVEARLCERAQQLAAHAAPALAFVQHKALAHDYWELAHLGEPRGEALIPLCGRAHEHAQAALALRPQDAGLHFLSGRILLAQMQLDAASSAFEAAGRCGLDARQVCAMQAEIAFKRQRYGDVRRHLARLGGSGHHLQLGKLASYWCGARA